MTIESTEKFMEQFVVNSVIDSTHRIVKLDNGHRYDICLAIYGYCNNDKHAEASSTLEVGDTIFGNQGLFDAYDSESDKTYQFGPLDWQCGRMITEVNHKDLVAIVRKGENIVFLKRVYG